MMRWTYDANVGAMYVRISDLPVDHQVEVAQGVVYDVTANDELVGIEVLSTESITAAVAAAPRFGLDETASSQLASLLMSGVLNVRVTGQGTMSAASRTGADERRVLLDA